MSKAVFLDRDGVITEDIGYVHKVEDFKLIKNAVEGLKLLKNYKLFIVTNQSGIGRGYFKLEDFIDYNKRVVEELKKNKIKIEKTYYCPHKPQDKCECRKPKTKLIKDAEKEFKIDLKKSFVIGDKKSDIEMGKNAGCRTILVMTGNGMKTINEKVSPHFIAEDFLEAAKFILKDD